jgi:hypothetical protein
MIVTLAKGIYLYECETKEACARMESFERIDNLNTITYEQQGRNSI